MRMLRGNAPQLRSYYSAGYNEAMHSGCAGTRHSERSSFPVGQIEFQISLRVRPPQLAASSIASWRRNVAVWHFSDMARCLTLGPLCSSRADMEADRDRSSLGLC